MAGNPEMPPLLVNKALDKLFEKTGRKPEEIAAYECNRNFNRNYINTTKESGYLTVDLKKLAAAFDIPYTRVSSESELINIDLLTEGPAFIELIVN